MKFDVNVSTPFRSALFYGMSRRNLLQLLCLYGIDDNYPVSKTKKQLRKRKFNKFINMEFGVVVKINNLDVPY